MSKWWLFIGTALVCSGFLLPLGVIILVWWFIDYIFKSGGVNTGSQHVENTYNINNLNIDSDSKDFGKDDFDTPMNYISNDAKEEMR